MKKIGFDFPKKPRNTILKETEENWYLNLLKEKKNINPQPIKRSNFGQYNMAVNYSTSVLEESKAVNNIAIYNIDHMAQVEFKGKDAGKLLNRVLPANIENMKIGQCKYSVLLTESGTVIDDLIVMKRTEENFVIVINAGHDITDKVEIDGEIKEFIADADYIVKYLKDGEDVEVNDISDQIVKIDIQGRYSFKLVKELYGESVMKNRNKPNKNMGYFTFNEFDFENEHYIISRTGYTSRWGFELYVPKNVAVEQFKRIVSKAVDLGGLLVGLGGRDENRTSAGNVGLPLNGSEYDQKHTFTNAPLFSAAVDLDKDFVGKSEIIKELAEGATKQMVLVISEGIVVGRGVYSIDGKRLGTVTSSINSPNVSMEQRKFIGSKRKSVNLDNGTAAIGLAWLYDSPFKDEPENIRVHFFKEDGNKKTKGKPVLGYISTKGVMEATAPKPLKRIANL
jgi:aminomethyltransferase